MPSSRTRYRNYGVEEAPREPEQGRCPARASRGLGPWHPAHLSWASLSPAQGRSLVQRPSSCFPGISADVLPAVKTLLASPSLRPLPVAGGGGLGPLLTSLPIVESTTKCQAADAQFEAVSEHLTLCSTSKSWYPLYSIFEGVCTICRHVGCHVGLPDS